MDWSFPREVGYGADQFVWLPVDSKLPDEFSFGSACSGKYLLMNFPMYSFSLLRISKEGRWWLKVALLRGSIKLEGVRFINNFIGPAGINPVYSFKVNI